MTAAAGGGAGHAAAGGVGRPAGDYRPSDFALAVATAAVVLSGAALVLRGGVGKGLSGRQDTMLEVPVRIVGLPDPDAPLLKLGGGPGAAKGRPRPPEASPKAPKKGAGAPPPGEIAPKEPTPGEPGPAETADPAGPGAREDTNSAQKPAEGESPTGGGAAVADAGAAGTGLGGPPGEGHPEGVPGGTETDPLKARAADVYRARLIAWFSSRFRVTGSGLPEAELRRLRAPATVTISGDRRVLGYSLTPSGNAVFDAAARRALEGAVGATLPPPPESYPDLVQGQISLTFVCTEGRCD